MNNVLEMPSNGEAKREYRKLSEEIQPEFPIIHAVCQVCGEVFLNDTHNPNMYCVNDHQLTTLLHGSEEICNKISHTLNLKKAGIIIPHRN